MDFSNLVKISVPTAAVICQQLPAMDEATRGLLTDNPTPQQFLQQLAQAKNYRLLIQFLAQALPKREAVWWACICCHAIISSDTKEPVQFALQAAKDWVREPNEAQRRLAETAVQHAGYDHPACWAALAAFWSHGSLTPVDQPMVAPPDKLCGQAVAGAISLAAVLNEPQQADARYQQFIRQGINIAQGGDGNID
jgi:hypothetical protein